MSSISSYSDGLPVLQEIKFCSYCAMPLGCLDFLLIAKGMAANASGEKPGMASLPIVRPSDSDKPLFKHGLFQALLPEYPSVFLATCQ